MASLLDTLVIAFTSDNTSLKKGAGEAQDAIEETKETVVDTDKAAQKLGATFLDTIKSAKGTIAAFVSVGAIARSVITQAAETAALGDFSKAINANIEDVDAWGKAIAREGGSAADFQGSIKSLTDSVTELTLTGSGPAAEAFARLGIQAVNSSGKMKSAFDLLPEIADSFEKLSATQSLALGQQLGLDQATILLLQRGRSEVDAQIAKQKELGVATQDDADKAREFRESMQDLQNVFSSLTRNVGAILLPAFTFILEGLEGIVNFLRDNTVFVTAFFASAAAIITIAYLPAIYAAAAATLVTISPFLIMAAVVTAVGLAIGILVDDIVEFSRGAPSIIGSIKDWFLNGFAAMSESVEDTWQTVKDFFSDLKSGLIDGITAFSQGALSIIDRIENGFLNGFAAITDSINDTWQTLKDFFSDLKSGLIDGIAALSKGTLSVIDSIKDSFLDAFSIIVEASDIVLQKLKDFVDYIKNSLVDGITGAFDKSADAVKGFAKEIPLIGRFIGDDDNSDNTEAALSADDVKKFAKDIPLIGRFLADDDLANAEAALNAPQKAPRRNLDKAEAALSAAENNPLTGQSARDIAQTSNSINRSTSVSVAAVNVDARGSDSGEISANISDALRDEMSATVSNYDDGVTV